MLFSYKGRLKSLFVLQLVFFSTFALASFEVPTLQKPVTDEANIISSKTEGQLDHLLQQYNKETQVQLAVLTVESLEGLSIEQASIQVVDLWKLGKAKTDKGVLLLIAPNERKLRIEVGQGLEGDLTDLYSKRIIDYQIVPSFKKGQFEAGIVNGVFAIIEKATPGYKLSSKPKVRKSKKKKQSTLLTILEILFILFIIFFGRGGGLTGYLIGRSMGSSRGYSSGSYSSGGFSSGGFSGGGGGFSGGGASGGW